MSKQSLNSILNFTVAKEPIPSGEKQLSCFVVRGTAPCFLDTFVEESFSETNTSKKQWVNVTEKIINTELFGVVIAKMNELNPRLQHHVINAAYSLDGENRPILLVGATTRAN